MALRIKADVVNAFLVPALEQLRILAGSETTLERMELARELPASMVTLRIELHGGLEGPIYWAFDPSLAKQVAGNMAVPGSGMDFDSAAMQADAIAELANIIVGNATGALLAAGYHVEMEAPQAQHADKRALPNPGLPNLVVVTPAGRVRIVFGVKIAPTPPPPPQDP